MALLLYPAWGRWWWRGSAWLLLSTGRLMESHQVKLLSLAAVA